MLILIYYRFILTIYWDLYSGRLKLFLNVDMRFLWGDVYLTLLRRSPWCQHFATIRGTAVPFPFFNMGQRALHFEKTFKPHFFVLLSSRDRKNESLIRTVYNVSDNMNCLVSETYKRNWCAIVLWIKKIINECFTKVSQH